MRNKQFEESSRGRQELIRGVETTLREELPPSWSARVVPDPSAPGVPGGRLDAAIVITTPAGVVVEFAAEVRTFGRGSAIDAATRGALLRDVVGMPTVLITNFANPALRDACVQTGIGFADATGWLRLVSDSPPLLIKTQGAAKSTATTRPGSTVRLNGPASARIIRMLLQASVPIGVRELAAASQVSPGTVAKLLPTLARDGAIERADTGAVARVRPRLLLNRWTADYSFAQSNPEVRWYLAPRGVDDVLSRISEEDDVTATGSLALREYLPTGTVPVTPLVLATFYTPHPAETAERLRLVDAEPGTANVALARPADTSLLGSGPRRGPMGYVPITQAIADLLTLPGRSPEEAEQLINYLAATDPAWSAEVKTT